jgi:hypothetical protein
MGNVHLAIIGKIDWLKHEANQAIYAAPSNRWMAFQNEPTSSCVEAEQSLSSDGSITASRFMPTLEIRFTSRLPLRNRRSLSQPSLEAVALFPERATVGKLKRQPVTLARIQYCARPYRCKQNYH